jgi:hypothetical protein
MEFPRALDGFMLERKNSKKFAAPFLSIRFAKSLLSPCASRKTVVRENTAAALNHAVIRDH